MPGTETHGFDMVMEFAENAYRDLLGVIFDTDAFLEKILAMLGINVDLASAFSVDVFLDRPSDPGIPAGASDLIDIRIYLGEGGTGSLGQLRIVAEVDVDHGAPGVDLVRVNLREKLHVAEASVFGFPLPAGLFATVLRNNVQLIPLLAVPVVRATTTPTIMREADVRVVDDPSPADRDATAFLFTFGGGAPGARRDFTRSFISPGGNGGIAVSFDWLCRIISPAIDSALQLGGAFTNCRLTRTVRFDEEEEVDLTALSLTPEDGFIRVAATVRKSGFCYEASGSVAAKIKIEVQNGRLIVASEVDDPDVDVDIPWYCWIAGAVLGALLGGILFGAIGAIVGGVLVPLIQWVAAEVIEGIIEEVAERIVEAINDISPDLDVPAVGIRIIFSNAFIDDVVIGCAIEPVDDVPIRSQGTVLVPNGAYVDLDSGRVGDSGLASADLAWLGQGFGRQLRAVCGARLARTWTTGLDGVTRSRLYRYQYEAPSPVPLPELAQLNPLGGLFGDRYRERLYVYGVRTNEGRYSAVQVVQVEDGFIRLRYRTFEKRLPTVQIKGGFRCEPRFGRVDPATVRFVPSPVLVAAVADVVTPAAVSTGTSRLEDVLAGGRTSAERDPCEPLLASVRALLPQAAVEQETLRRVPLEDRRIGRWVGTAVSRGANVGRFDAVVEGFSSDVTVRWRIDDHALAGTSGVVQLPDAAVHYQVRGRRLVLSVDGNRSFEFLLTVIVADDDGTTVTAQRCVRFENTCTTPGRYLPSWPEFKAAYMEHFGIVEVERSRVSEPSPRSPSTGTAPSPSR